MSTKQELDSWDGKSSDDIGVIYANHSEEPSFGFEIVDLLGIEAYRTGASWLLKKHLETKGALDPGDIEKVFRVLPELEDWGSKLHLLQCLPFLPIKCNQKAGIEQFLRKCLVSRNKFVRAWAYNGFYLLSEQYPEYKEETLRFFEMARRDESASVKARIRNIQQKGFKK